MNHLLILIINIKGVDKQELTLFQAVQLDGIDDEIDDEPFTLCPLIMGMLHKQIHHDHGYAKILKDEGRFHLCIFFTCVEKNKQTKEM